MPNSSSLEDYNYSVPSCNIHKEKKCKRKLLGNCSVRFYIVSFYFMVSLKSVHNL